MANNRSAREYAAALQQVPEELRHPIENYVRTIRRQNASMRHRLKENRAPGTEAASQSPTRPEFTAALLETITSTQAGATLNQLTTIATRHNLAAQEHANLGQTLWHAAQQGLLPESGARDRTPPHAREPHHPETETQE